ncbi:MAG TPA: S8 family serine peptidase [Candidatus Bathyarchaeia archaeon]|nr:S8 family serine peptidase [Candidatus Bathyarchaeia archaeon]
MSGLAGCTLALLVPGLTATEAGTDPRAEPAERVEIRLDPLRLPAGDRSRLAEMRIAVHDAIARDARMFGGFEPRDVLAETIAALRSRGARFERHPIVNFDTIEVELPAARRDGVARLPFVRSLGAPGRVAPAAPPYDSAGLPVIRATDAHTNGILGAGARVAIVDEGFHELDATIGASELPPVTLDEQFLVSADGSSIASGSSLDGLGTNAHGSACAEVVGEVAPQAAISLYAVTSSAGIEAAIRHAADQGMNVILVALAEIRTLGDADPATNRYVDDVAYARAKGTTVVFAAGDEAQRHYSATFAACGASCGAQGDGGGCTGDDSAYHAFSAGAPLAPLGFQVPCDSSVDPSCAITCTGALESNADPSLFHLQLFATQGAACPSDPGATLLADVPLGQDLDLADVNSVASGYSLGVLQLPGAPAPGLPNLTPRFRVDCWSPVTSMDPAVAAGSLSDMAVVPDALAVGALDGVLDPSFSTIAAYSSQGLAPADPSAVKPDLSAPSEVANFAIENDPASAASHFGGTSAAAAHAAGAVAIMQSRELMLGNPPLAVDEVKQELAAAAIDLGPAGADPIYGNGRLDLPDSAIAPTALCGNGSLDPGEQCDAGAANGAPGSCCTAGCHVFTDGTACSDGNSCTLAMSARPVPASRVDPGSAPRAIRVTSRAPATLQAACAPIPLHLTGPGATTATCARSATAASPDRARAVPREPRPWSRAMPRSAPARRRRCRSRSAASAPGRSSGPMA